MVKLDHQRSAANTLVNKMRLDIFVLFNIFNYCSQSINGKKSNWRYFFEKVTQIFSNKLKSNALLY